MDKLAVDFLRGWFMKRVLAVVCLIACCSPSPAQEKSKSKINQAGTEVGESANLATAKLPVRRVVLYKNGVGYFEHLGHVRGNQDVHVDFTSAQLNDVLKSLTVLTFQADALRAWITTLKLRWRCGWQRCGWRWASVLPWRSFSALCAAHDWKCAAATGRRWWESC